MTAETGIKDLINVPCIRAEHSYALGTGRAQAKFGLPIESRLCVMV